MQRKWKGKRDKLVVGGLHMTHISYLPDVILKRITNTERFEAVPVRMGKAAIHEYVL